MIMKKSCNKKTERITICVRPEIKKWFEGAKRIGYDIPETTRQFWDALQKQQVEEIDRAS